MTEPHLQWRRAAALILFSDVISQSGSMNTSFCIELLTALDSPLKREMGNGIGVRFGDTAMNNAFMPISAQLEMPEFILDSAIRADGSGGAVHCCTTAALTLRLRASRCQAPAYPHKLPRPDSFALRGQIRSICCPSTLPM